VEPQRESMKAIIKKIGYDYGIDIVELEMPEDHIHMVIRSEPKLSPSKIMQVIKSISAREFFRLFLGRKIMDKKLFCRDDW
jgi:REP-associated tyrosine transposase